MPDNILATVCFLSVFLPATHVPSVGDTELLGCLHRFSTCPTCRRYLRINILAVGTRYCRVTHGFSCRQYVATYIVRVVRGWNTVSGELQTIVCGNGADAAVKLVHTSVDSPEVRHRRRVERGSF